MPIHATPSQVRPKARSQNRLLRGPLVLMCGLWVGFLGACQSLGQEEGFVPNTIRSANSVLKPGDYPDLSKIPDAPTNLPSQKSWTELQAGLQADAKKVQANPGAKPVTASEIDQSWAAQEKQSIEANSASVPTEQTTAESDAWATAARAKMEADLARLPPT